MKYIVITVVGTLAATFLYPYVLQAGRRLARIMKDLHEAVDEGDNNASN